MLDSQVRTGHDDANDLRVCLCGSISSYTYSQSLTMQNAYVLRFT